MPRGRLLGRVRGEPHFDDPVGGGGSRILTILSGFVTEPLLAFEPFLILSTTSIPEVTSPMTVYLPLRKEASSKQMKNCEFAESGSLERAMPTVPRLNGVFENSALIFGRSDLPVPVPVGSPVCAIKPSITRWKTIPS